MEEEASKGIPTLHRLDLPEKTIKKTVKNRGVDIDFHPLEKTMTLEEIASVCNIGISTVKRAVEKLRPVLGAVSVSNQGGYLLTEKQATLIKEEVRKHHNLENRDIDSVKTDYEMELMTQQVLAYHLQKAKEYKQRAEIAESKLIQVAPKVDFYDKVTGSSDTVDIGQAAKILAIKGLGRNKLFEILRNADVLNESNQPYQKYVDAGYFRIIESRYLTPDGETHIGLKTVVFQKGLEYIRRLAEGKYGA